MALSDRIAANCLAIVSKEHPWNAGPSLFAEPFKAWAFGRLCSAWRQNRLGGFVRNEGGAVRIDVEGDSEQLDQFLSDLYRAPPALASIDDMHWTSVSPRGDREFRIEVSNTNTATVPWISADIATCDECLTELFDLAGSPLSVSLYQLHQLRPEADDCRRAAYDRERTTMAAFAMCDACRANTMTRPTDGFTHSQSRARNVVRKLRFGESVANGSRPAIRCFVLRQMLREGRSGR